MKLGIRGHDLGKNTASGLAKAIKAKGFDGVQLVLSKAIIDETGEKETLTEAHVKALVEPFIQEGVEIPLLGAYFNPIHSNPTKVKDSIEKFKAHLRVAPWFQAKLVGSETGSFNDDKWTYHPDNRHIEVLDRVVEVFQELVDVAKEVGVNVAVEGANGHVAYNPQAIHYMLNKIQSPHLRVIVDVYNFLNAENTDQHTQIFDECIALFADKIDVFHLKDFVLEENKLKQVPPGKGWMNYPYLLSQITKHCPNAYLIFEGVDASDIDASKAFIQSLLKEEEEQ